MEIGLQLLICLTGLVVYILSKDGKIENISLHMFWVGLLALLLNGKEIVALFH
jgi:hypothetical protein